MTLYIGVDFHPYQQTVAWCNSETGETQTLNLFHELEKVKEFYQKLEPGIVAIEASTKAQWFENLLSETGHQLLVGNPNLIRRRASSRHKSDRRDAELILELLMRDEFPVIRRRSREENQVLEILKLRHSLVRQRTQTYNRLQGLARSLGLAKGTIKAKCYEVRLRTLEVDEADRLVREELLKMVESFNARINELEKWLDRRAAADREVQLLQTQKGVGYLTALALRNSIGDISRFSRPTKQVPAYLGLEPLERESAGKRKKGGISRAGNFLTRYLLGQAAHLATRTDKSLKVFYQRLAKKKPKGVAKTATARKLLVKLVIMWRDQITAQEFDQRGGTVNDTRTVQGLK